MERLEPQTARAPQEGSGARLGEIATAVVRAHKEFHGRGPDTTRVDFAGDDLLVCRLEGCMTRAERTLVDHGSAELVAHTRALGNRMTEPRLLAMVEAVTERSVVSHLISYDPAADLHIETFVLARSDEIDVGAPGIALAAEAALARRRAQSLKRDSEVLHAEHDRARDRFEGR